MLLQGRGAAALNDLSPIARRIIGTSKVITYSEPFLPPIRSPLQIKISRCWRLSVYRLVENNVYVQSKSLACQSLPLWSPIPLMWVPLWGITQDYVGTYAASRPETRSCTVYFYTSAQSHGNTCVQVCLCVRVRVHVTNQPDAPGRILRAFVIGPFVRPIHAVS